MVFCSLCGANNTEGSTFCSSCGGSISPAKNENSQQNTQPVQAAMPNIVVNVQQQQQQQQAPLLGHFDPSMPSDKSGATALILCLFLGMFGGHQFYAGRSGTGILYFFTMGFFGIGVFIDAISIVTNSYKDQYGRVMRL